MGNVRAEPPEIPSNPHVELYGLKKPALVDENQYPTGVSAILP